MMHVLGVMHAVLACGSPVSPPGPQVPRGGAMQEGGVQRGRVLACCGPGVGCGSAHFCCRWACQHNCSCDFCHCEMMIVWWWYHMGWTTRGLEMSQMHEPFLHAWYCVSLLQNVPQLHFNVQVMTCCTQNIFVEFTPS